MPLFDTVIGTLIGSFFGCMMGIIVLGTLEARRNARQSTEDPDPGESPVGRLACQGRPGCTAMPITTRVFHGGDQQRLCAACANDPQTIPPDRRPPGTPNAQPTKPRGATGFQ